MKQAFFLGLIGYPLVQSRSPDLHHAALRASGLRGEYRLYPIAPLPEGKTALEAILQKLRAGELHGLNVTIPHKQAVLPYLDRLTPVAQAVGAVNTLFMENGRLIGDNTDAEGFLTDLRRLLPERHGHALVLGAGGSARAVVYALARAGWRVTVAARRVNQAAMLIGDLALHQTARAIPLQADSLARLTDLALIVNATPVGMIPNIHASPLPEGAPLPSGAVLYDLIYKPPETLLMRQGRAAGLKVFNGLGMLVEQAALSFERWTGIDPDRAVMRQAIGEI